eukprot:TRINITY_DN8671_c0_g1_i1.p1 TRINITY_DN8671_c0_g1~~TRINITY_DN8671_c0_g1_i1.p1  ORF type:complete len:248 (+),score=43.25 TRINITY_DN8671_c0_g1_i1:75-818(+)
MQRTLRLGLLLAGGAAAVRLGEDASTQKSSVNASTFATLGQHEDLSKKYPSYTYAGNDPEAPNLAFFQNFKLNYANGGGHSVGAMTTHFLKELGIPADVWMGTTAPVDKAGKPVEKPCKGPAAGQRYIVVTLSGYVEFETCLEGEHGKYPGWEDAPLPDRQEGKRQKAILSPGHLLIADDAVGPAHHWRILENPNTGKKDPWNRLYIDLTDDKAFEAFQTAVEGGKLGKASSASGPASGPLDLNSMD